MRRTEWKWIRAETVVATIATCLIIAARFLLALRSSFCGTPDACTYLGLAEALGRGQGFRLDFAYQYQFISAHLPTHGVEYWRPGTSLFLLLARPFGTIGLHSGLVVTIAAGIVCALAAWRIAKDTGQNDWIACGCYLLCLVLPPVWSSSLQTDSTLFYGACGAWVLTLFRVQFRSYLEDAVAWLLLVALNIIRNDAVLMLVPIVVVLALRRRCGLRRGASTMYAATVFLAFFGALLPMSLISYLATHRFSSGVVYQSLFISDVSQLTNYGPPPSVATILGAGLLSIVKARVVASTTIIFRIVFLMIGFGSVFLSVIPIQVANRSRNQYPEVTGGLAFAAAILIAYGVMMPGIGTFSALRSFTTLLPLTAVFIVCAIDWMCHEKSISGFVCASVFLFYAISGFMETRREVVGSNIDGTTTRQLAETIQSSGVLPGETVIMTPDPAQFSVTTGFAAIPVPNNGSNAILHAICDLKPGLVVLSPDQVNAFKTIGKAPSEGPISVSKTGMFILRSQALMTDPSSSQGTSDRCVETQKGLGPNSLGK